MVKIHRLTDLLTELTVDDLKKACEEHTPISFEFYGEPSAKPGKITDSKDGREVEYTISHPIREAWRAYVSSYEFWLDSTFTTKPAYITFNVYNPREEDGNYYGTHRWVEYYEITYSYKDDTWEVLITDKDKDKKKK